MSTPPRRGKSRTSRAADKPSGRTPLEPFTLKDPTLEELAHRLAKLYSDVELSHYPMFSWVQIINDGTILGEDLRRGPDRLP